MKKALWIVGAVALSVMAGCSASSGEDTGSSADELRATIGPEGGELVGEKGTKLEGVHVVIPPGAIGEATEIRIRPATDATPLPAAAKACGPTFEMLPAGLALAKPAEVTLPFDEQTVTDTLRFDDEVKVWVRQGDGWGQELQTASAEGSVTIETSTFANVAAGVNPPKDEDVYRFSLKPSPKTLNCLAQYPGDAKRAPSAEVIVVRGEQNDALFLRIANIEPKLAFDMFTVQNSSLLADGSPDPAFKNFGLAWYQSDLETRDNGRGSVAIRTILLDQIFGFDPAVALGPNGTFHVGFWFNDPNAAAACGFDASKPTPFNGDHAAGPLAMITTPDASSTLGPLCTHPDTSVTPAKCDP